jgi:hypothetical protein
VKVLRHDNEDLASKMIFDGSLQGLGNGGKGGVEEFRALRVFAA